MSKKTGAALWTEAESHAQSKSFEFSGVSYLGHLATLTSASENSFLALSFDKAGWIGGFQPDQQAGAVLPSDNWQWVTGEPWAHTNWRSLEPNDEGPETDTALLHGYETNGENYLEFLFGGADDGQWNDFWNSPAMAGYFIEFEPVQEDTQHFTTPEPGTIMLLGTGLIGLAGSGRRRRRKG